MEYLGIFLNKMKNTPLYYQLYSELIKKIQSGKLIAGEKLPGKRTAAQEWGISVNTVDQAYQMLAAEGYVYAKQRSGFIVNKAEQNKIIIQQPKQEKVEEPSPSSWEYNFASSGSDSEFFPRKTWNRISREVLSEESELFSHGEANGDGLLRKAISEYLTNYRGVECTQKQIVVGAGLEVLLSFLAQLFYGEQVAVEDPGYPKAAHVFKNAELEVLPIEVDEEGISVSQLTKSGASIVYVTPSHQFPTGGTMPIARRLQLLQWAQTESNIIIEDDYDSEYRFDGKPLPSLQGLDGGNRVIYAGTFSRSLAPSLRIAYLVLPQWILNRWEEKFKGYACTVSRLEQHTLAKFMQNGHFYRGLNRQRNIYKKRRNLVIEALQKYLYGDEFKIINQHTGLYFLLKGFGRDAQQIVQELRAKKVNCKALNEYVSENKEKYKDIIVLGYGGLKEGQIREGVKKVADMLKKYK